MNDLCWNVSSWQVCSNCGFDRVDDGLREGWSIFGFDKENTVRELMQTISLQRGTDQEKRQRTIVRLHQEVVDRLLDNPRHPRHSQRPSSCTSSNSFYSSVSIRVAISNNVHFWTSKPNSRWIQHTIRSPIYHDSLCLTMQLDPVTMLPNRSLLVRHWISFEISRVVTSHSIFTPESNRLIYTQI